MGYTYKINVWLWIFAFIQYDTWRLALGPIVPGLQASSGPPFLP